jgi:hypothetical protein
MMLPVGILFLLGGTALIVSLHFFRQASRRRRLGRPFAAKAGMAFLSFLVAALLSLLCLFWLAHLLKGRTGANSAVSAACILSDVFSC